MQEQEGIAAREEEVKRLWEAFEEACSEI